MDTHNRALVNYRIGVVMMTIDRSECQHKHWSHFVERLRRGISATAYAGDYYLFLGAGR